MQKLETLVVQMEARIVPGELLDGVILAKEMTFGVFRGDIAVTNRFCDQCRLSCETMDADDVQQLVDSAATTLIRCDNETASSSWLEMMTAINGASINGRLWFFGNSRRPRTIAMIDVAESTLSNDD